MRDAAQVSDEMMGQFVAAVDRINRQVEGIDDDDPNAGQMMLDSKLKVQQLLISFETTMNQRYGVLKKFTDEIR